MLRQHILKRLASVLVLLMLADSSLAVEMLVHERMPGSDSYAYFLHHDDNHGMGPAGHSEAMQTAGHIDAPVMELDNQKAAQDLPIDCLCDDVCCAGSVNVLDSCGKTLLINPADNLYLSSRFYQSVNLDLVQPPPIL